MSRAASALSEGGWRCVVGGLWAAGRMARGGAFCGAAQSLQKAEGARGWSWMVSPNQGHLLLSPPPKGPGFLLLLLPLVLVLVLLLVVLRQALAQAQTLGRGQVRCNCLQPREPRPAAQRYYGCCGCSARPLGPTAAAAACCCHSPGAAGLRAPEKGIACPAVCWAACCGPAPAAPRPDPSRAASARRQWPAQ